MSRTDKDSVLTELEREKETCGDETELKQYSELQGIIKQIDLSVLDSDSGHIASSCSKRRKTISRKKNEELTLEKYEKEYEDTLKQIELVKEALKTIYDMENSRFTKFVSTRGDKRSKVVNRGELIDRIVENGKAIPLWIGRHDEVPPVLCGAIEAGASYVAKVGDLVAALIKPDPNNWILAEVIGYDCKAKEYKVVDIYEDLIIEYTLSKEKVIPLPKMRADPENNSDALFPEGALVLALYPQSTCFYRAVVSQRPLGPDDPYRLLFEDSTPANGYLPAMEVHQRYVINFKDNRDDEGDPDNEKVE